MKVDWKGVYPAATTHFNSDLSLDLESNAKHIERMIEAGIHGIIMLGTVGENTSLEREEKLQVLKMAKEVANGRIPVLTGVAEYTTTMGCDFAKAAADVGVDGLMVLPTMVYKSDARETITHFREVAHATDLPIMCYNNPVSYGVDISPEMFAELADEPTLVAIKESSEDVRRITDLINIVGDRYTLFSGVDDLALECALLGTVGTVSGLVCAFPRETVRMWELASAGEWDKALEIYRWFTPSLHLDTYVKLVQYIKLATAETGLGSETVRPAKLPIIGEERERVLKIIRTAIENRPDVG